MERFRARLWQTPDRLPLRRARLLAGLAVACLAPAFFAFALALALGGRAAADDLHDLLGLLAAGIVGLIGLGSLALALGSLLPEAGGGRALRAATRPLVLLLLLAGPAFFALRLKATVVDGESASWLAAVGGAAAVLAGRWRRGPRNGASG